MAKSGVAVDGKVATDPANGKANGQVSASDQSRAASTGTRVWLRTRPRPRQRGWQGGGDQAGIGCAGLSGTVVAHDQFTISE